MHETHLQDKLPSRIHGAAFKVDPVNILLMPCPVIVRGRVPCDRFGNPGLDFSLAWIFQYIGFHSVFFSARR